MSGKPAARMGDATLKGGPIIKGSLTVLIGSSGGVACSTCPGGKTVGSPVNPALGAKVLSDETDFALPGPMTLAWSRTYSSYVSADNKNAAGEDAARVGLLGPGWHLPTALAIEIDGNDQARLFDGKGRVISFTEPLPPGALLGSLSESLSLYRFKPNAALAEQGHSPQTQLQLQRRLDQVSATAWSITGKRAVNVILAWSAGGDTVWVFERMSLIGPNRTRWQLAAMVDRYGRTLSYHFDRLGRPAGFTDGAGRRYRMKLIDSRVSSGLADEATLPGGANAASYNPADEPAEARRMKSGVRTPWGIDDGLRLAAIYLDHDPHDGGKDAAPGRLLVAYGYSSGVGSTGDLNEVYAGTGTPDPGPVLRRFSTHQGFMLGHQYADGGSSSYVYERTPPTPNADGTSPMVILQTNVDGLDYRFDYAVDTQGVHTHTTVTDNLKRRETYRFEGAGGLKRLTEHIRADGSRTRYAHDAHGRLTEDIDALGRTTTYQLDAEGAIVSVKGPAGATQSTRDPVSGKLTSHTGVDGATSTYRYDTHDRLIETTAPDGSRTQLAYPEIGTGTSATPDNPIQITDPSGKHKAMSWSVLGQLIAYTDCSGQTTRYRYHRDGQLAETTDAAGRKSTQQHDRRDRKTASHSPDGRHVSYQYGGRSGLQLTSVTEHPAGSASATSTGYHYDPRGRLIGVKREALALGYVWDRADRLTTLINENNARTEFAYDVMDRLVQEHGFDGRTQQYAYDLGGRLIASREATSANTGRNAGGNNSNVLATPTIHYAYDEADRLIERRLPATAHASAITDQMGYDAGGRLTGIARYRGEITTDTNTNANTKATAQPEPESKLAFAYDVMGRLTGEQQRHAAARVDGSPFIHATQHQYDILGNRVGSTLPELGAAGTLNLLTYGSGHLHALQLGGHTLIDFERDRLHQETERSFAGLHLTRELDPVGRLLNQRQERQATRAADYLTAAYRYNGSGQLIEVERSASIDASTGIATALYPEPQHTQYQYDRAERLSATVRIGNTSSVQRHQFDGAGNRLPALIPEHHLAQRQVAATQDQTDQRSRDWGDTVQAGLNDPNFNVLQNESSLGRGQREPVAQWTDNRVHYDGVYSYQYDGAGNRIKRTHIDGTTDTYGYDGDHRLVHHCAMNETGQITHATENDYDALGRRIRRRVTMHARAHASLSSINANANANTNATTQTTHYGWDGDRLVYVETEHHKTHTVYEPGSFVPLLRITQATHDKAEQAKQAKTDAMQLMGLTDDDNSDAGTADKKIADSTDTTDWQAMNAGLSSAAKAPLPELAKQILRDMGMNPDDVHRDLKKQVEQQKAKTRESLTVHLYHCNHLGTPVALVNEQGNIDWAIELDAWGNTVNEYQSNPSNPIEQPIRMQGQQLDPSSGLFYNRHRFYDPQLGRYLNQDPIGLVGGMNVYSYTSNRPNSVVDPNGLMAQMAAGCLAGSWAGPFGCGAGALIAGIVTLGVVGIGAVVMSSDNSGTGAVPQTNADAEKARDRQGYHNRCDEKEPPNLASQCDRWKWRLNRDQDCVKLREQFSKKWYDGQYDGGHAEQIQQKLNSIADLQDKIGRLCK